jgi:hypothetical protein
VGTSRDVVGNTKPFFFLRVLLDELDMGPAFFFSCDLVVVFYDFM